MEISETTRRILEARQAKAGPPLSDVSRRILEQRQLEATRGLVQNLGMPDFTTSNSTPQEYASDGAFKNILFKGVLGGASAQDYQDVAKMMGQGMARGYGVTGELVSSAIKDPLGVSMKDSRVDPNTFFGNSERAKAFGNSFFGTNESFDADQEGREIFEAVGLHSSTPWQNATFAVLLTSADLFTGGGASGFSRAIKELKATDDIIEVSAILKGVGFSEEVIEDYASIFAKLTDEKDLAILFKEATEAQAVLNKIDEVPVAPLKGPDPVTVKGNAFSEAVDSFKLGVRNAAESAGISAKAFGDSTVKAYRSVLRAIDEAEVDVSGLSRQLDEIENTIKAEPQRFVPGAKVADDVPPGPHDDPGFGTNPMDELDDAFKAEQEEKFFDSMTDAERKAYDEGYIKDQDERLGPAKTEPETLKTPNEVKVKELTETGEAQSDVVVGFETGKTGKTKVVVYNADKSKVVGDIIDLEKAEVKYGTKDPTELANRIVNGRFDSGTDSWKVIEPKKGKKLDTVADPVKNNLSVVASHVQERYGKAAVTVNNAKKVAKTEKEVYGELVDRKKGARWPEWVPKNLRVSKYTEELAEILGEGGIPTIHGGPHMELYTALVDETAKRAGVKVTKGNLPAIDGSGAFVQSMRENTAHPAAPKLREEPGVKQGFFRRKKKDDSVSFEDEEKFSLKTQFQKYREKQGREVREGMGEADPEDFKWMDDEDLNFDADAGKVKRTVGTFRANNETVFQLSERVLRENWTKVKEKVFDSLDAAKGNYARELKELNLDLAEFMVKGLKIKRKSEESAWVQRLGDTTAEYHVSYDQVVKKFGPERAADIREAAQWFRQRYDELIVSRNATRGPDDQIIPRPDYFRHFQEMSDVGKLKNNFENTGLTNLTELGLTETITGKKKGRKFSIYKSREGEETVLDAVGGMADYIPQYAYEKYINPEIPKISSFINKLKEKNAPAGYVQYLERWADDLAFASSPIDEGFAKSHGQLAIEVLNWFNSRAKRNAVLLNPGSGLAQAFNLMNITSEAGVKHSVKGMRDMMMDIGNPNALWRQDSNFIAERTVANSARDLSVGFWEKTTDKAGLMISVLDEVVAIMGFYMLRSKGESLGLTGRVASKYGDDLVRKNIGGRGIGEVSPIQKSKMMQLFIPFSLEAVNQLHVVAGRAAKAGKGNPEAFAQSVHWLVASWVMNQYVEKLTGHSVSMDPLGAAFDTYDISQGVDEDKKKMMAARMGGEFFQGLPMGKYVLSGLQGLSGMDDDQRKKYFGEGDPLRYGSAPLLANAISPIVQAFLPDTEDKELSDKERFGLIIEGLFKILPPLGGNQLKKTGEGALFLGEDFPEVDRREGIPGVLQTLVFGKWGPNIKYEADREEIMRDLYHSVDDIYQTGEEGLKKAVEARLELLTPKEREVFMKVAGEEKAIQKQKDVNNMMPTYRAVSAMYAAGADQKAQEVLSGFTPREREIWKETHKQYMDEASEIARGVETDPESLLKEVMDYGYAMGTNPKQAFKAIFSGQHIEGTEGKNFLFGDLLGGQGTVIIRRMPEKGTGGSAEVKTMLMKEQGITDETSVKLEHKLPLTMGGSNKLENLELVTNAVHDASTWMEIYMGKAVKAGLLGRDDAQQLIMRYKGYTGEKITREEIMKIVGQESISEEEYLQGLDDKGSDTARFFSDQDYAERADPITGKAQGKRTTAHVERDKLIEFYK